MLVARARATSSGFGASFDGGDVGQVLRPAHCPLGYEPNRVDLLPG